MKLKQTITVLTLMLFGIGSTQAQEKPVLEDLLIPAITNITTGSDEQATQEAHAQFEKARTLFPEDAMPAYWEGFADYRLTVYYNRIQNAKDAQKFAEHGVAALEKTIELNPNDSEGYALLATLLGMLIQFEPMTGPTRGPLSTAYFQKAISLDPQNPRAYFLMAISTMFRPKMFGGGADIALPSFKTAMTLYENERQKELSGTLRPDWGYLDCHVFYAQALVKTGETDNAKTILQAALTINPDHGFAKYSLDKLLTDEKTDD